MRRRRAGENEDAGADDAADTERRDAQRPERLAKCVLARFGDDGGYRLSRHQTLVCHGDIPFDGGQRSLPIRMRALGCGIWMIVATRQEGKCIFLACVPRGGNQGEVLTVHTRFRRVVPVTLSPEFPSLLYRSEIDRARWARYHAEGLDDLIAVAARDRFS